MSRWCGLNRPISVDVQGMNHDELTWQDVLFKGFEVLVTTAVHSACGMVVRLSVHRDAGSCPACGRVSTRVHDRYERRLLWVESFGGNACIPRVPGPCQLPPVTVDHEQ